MKRLLYILALGAILTAAAQTRSPKGDVSRGLNVFSSIVRELQTSYVDSIDADKSFNAAIEAMLSQLDPYTEYISEADQEDFKTISTGQYVGIGSFIVQRDGNVYISEPQEGSPAREAGLRPGDLVWLVDGDTMLGKPSSEVSRRLKGEPGTQVKVTVRRPWVGADSVLTFDITRRTIDVNTLPYWGYVAPGVGYVELNTYNEKSPGVVARAIDSLKATGRLESLILDLRDNGGGLLESAVKIVGLFVPKGTEVVRHRGFNSKNDVIYKTTHDPIESTLPLVVLTNSGTASSSEITAGALQDLDRAVIIGTRSYGKGLVQGSRPLPYNGLLKLTTAKYYLPSGRLIQAIDYAHRAADGSASRIPDSLTTVYYTRAGRPVRDGGGITPEVKVEYPQVARIAYEIGSGFLPFDWANRYYASHPQAPDSMVITDEMFADFRSLIKPEKLKYNKYYAEVLDDIAEAAKYDGLLDSTLTAQLDTIKARFSLDVDRDLALNRKTVDQLLLSRLMSHYHPSRGETMARLASGDEAVDTAVAVLTDPARYRSLLAAPSRPKASKKK